MKYYRFVIGLIVIALWGVSPAHLQEDPWSRMITVHWNDVTGQVVVTSYDGIRIYDQNFQLLRFKPHPDPNKIIYAFWNPNGMKLIAGGKEIWDAQTLQPIVTIDSPTSVSQFNQDGSLIAGIGEDSKSITIYNTRTGQFVRRLSTDNNWLEYASWSPDNTRFAIEIGNTTIAILDAVNGGILHRFEQPHHISTLQWSRDSQFISYSSIDSTPGASSKTEQVLFSVSVINASTGRLIHTFDGLPTLITGFNWSADSSELTAISGVGVILIWDVATGELLDSFQIPEALVEAQYSQFGARLLLAVNTDVIYGVDIAMTPLSTISQKYLNGRFQVAVPTPSVAKLSALIQRCSLDPVVTENLQTLLAADQFQAFIEQVKGLTNAQLIPNCDLDMIAVAEVLED